MMKLLAEGLKSDGKSHLPFSPSVTMNPCCGIYIKARFLSTFRTLTAVTSGGYLPTSVLSFITDVSRRKKQFVLDEMKLNNPTTFSKYLKSCDHCSVSLPDDPLMHVFANQTTWPAVRLSAESWLPVSLLLAPCWSIGASQKQSPFSVNHFEMG